MLNAKDYERGVICMALTAVDGNVTAASELLKINRRTAHRMITALGLREWLTVTYPRTKRQPKYKKKKTAA